MNDVIDAVTARPRVSVVIPSYNHARFLPETIESVLKQTLDALELIIIDDGSRDESWDVIQRYAKADKRVVARRQENAGAHAAINAGLALARGDFLAILNSDDRYYPERLDTLCKLADDGAGLDFICTSQRLIDENGSPIPHHPWLDEYGRMLDGVRHDGLWPTLLNRNFTVSTSNFFMRRALWQALGPIRPLRYNMDWDYALRAYQAAPNRFAWRHDLPLWDYRLHGSNTILGGLPRSAIEANHLLYRSIQQVCKVPASAIAGLRRHHRLIRHQQVAATAAARDQWWEPRLQEAHEGWERTRKESDAVHARLGDTLTELGDTRTRLGETLTKLSEAHDAYNQVHHDLGVAIQERDHARRELAAVYASRSYRWGRRVTAPLRWLRSHVERFKNGPEASSAAQTSAATEAPVPSADAIPTPATANNALPPYRELTLPPVDDATVPCPRIAAHIHVHYVELLDELLDAVANIPCTVDLFVTTTQAEAAVAATVHTRFPTARVWQTPNQGKDIGPFIDALNRHRLHEYDLVLKLHGKKSQNHPGYLAAIRGLFGNDIADGDDWRRKLIAPIAGSPARVRQILDAFRNDAALGMVGAAQFICEAPDADPQAYVALCDRLGVTRGIRFFGGTMFWIRGDALASLVDAGITMDDFNPVKAGDVEGTLEHGLERVFGAIASAASRYLGGIR